MILYKNKTFITNSDHPNDDWIGDADYVLEDNSELTSKVFEYYPKFDIITETKTFTNDDGEEVTKDVVIDIIKITTVTEEEIKEAQITKKKEVSQACEIAITNGISVNGKHFSLTIEDQANILAWMAVAQTGKSVPYHADGERCDIYSAEEFMQIANSAVAHKAHHTTYCNLLMRQIETLKIMEEINEIKYGVTELTGEFLERYNEIMSSLA